MVSRWWVFQGAIPSSTYSVRIFTTSKSYTLRKSDKLRHPKVFQNKHLQLWSFKNKDMHVFENISFWSDVQSSSWNGNQTLPVQTLSFHFSQTQREHVVRWRLSILPAFFRLPCWQTAESFSGPFVSLSISCCLLGSGWADGSFYVLRLLLLVPKKRWTWLLNFFPLCNVLSFS